LLYNPAGLPSFFGPYGETLLGCGYIVNVAALVDPSGTVEKYPKRCDNNDYKSKEKAEKGFGKVVFHSPILLWLPHKRNHAVRYADQVGSRGVVGVGLGTIPVVGNPVAMFKIGKHT